MVAKGKFDFDGEEWDDISKDAKDLIKKLICKPEKRLTAQEALDHKWFKKALKSDAKKSEKVVSKKLEQFKKFSKKNQMQQVALTALAVQASPEDIRELKTLFLELDVNGDGSLTIEELAKGLQESQNGQHLIDILKSADTDGSGEINYTEFLAATMDST